MFISNYWKDYELLDCGDQERLERWGNIILRRPDPQAIWHTNKTKWKNVNAVYHRSEKGGGEWEVFSLPERWNICYNLQNDVNKKLTFNIKPFSFKHTGLFPEQATNWDFVSSIIEKNISHKKNGFKVLNLFAYTGAATIAALKSNAEVVHVDAAKGMIEWAKENAISSNVQNGKVRWIVDDCLKFVNREIRRGNFYDGIIMDPPSYGRGPSGEIWKLENSVYDLIKTCAELLNEESNFFLISSYTTGLQASVLTYMLEDIIKTQFGGKVESEEVGLTISKNKLILPCGSSGRWCK